MQKIAHKIIGLTGPIGAGKDQVAKVLKKCGAMVIDVDKLAHTLYYPQSPVWRDLFKTFGSKTLKRGGAINRKKLGEIVFADKKMLQQLNKIVHPALKEAVIRELESHACRQAGSKPMIVVNAAVLKEIGLVDLVDEVWLITASKEKRWKRLIKSGLSKENALRRINAQASQKDYLKIADLVIKNDGTIKELNEKVRAGIEL
jgi:dephospho-CoA kinase